MSSTSSGRSLLAGDGQRRERGLPPGIAGAQARPQRRLLAFVAGAPATLLLLLIRLYQRTLSPALPVLTLGRCGCRFSPTCSHYAAEAIRTHGAVAGVGLAIARLIKCTPLHPGGFDPVPRRRSALRCERVAG